MRSITLDQFKEELKAQGVPRVHLAFKCPICKTIQSMASLMLVGAGKSDEQVEGFIGFSCVGWWTNAGPGHGAEPGKGCDWTLGGFLHLHELEVITPDGVRNPRFELASAEQAKELMAANGWRFSERFERTANVSAASAPSAVESEGARQA